MRPLEAPIIYEPCLADKHGQRQVRAAPYLGQGPQGLRLEELDIIHAGRWMELDELPQLFLQGSRRQGAAGATYYLLRPAQSLRQSASLRAPFPLQITVA